MMDPRQFLAALWGEKPPGMINIWMLPDQKSYWYPDLDNVNRDMQHHLHEEVYTGVALAKKEGTRFNTGSRVKEVDAAAIPGVWSDIDVFHPSEKVHKDKILPGTVEQAQEVMTKLPHSPTLIVDSGHGLQYWWLLEEPWVFRDQGEWEQARRMTQWWHRITKELFNTMGWNTDSVFDLSRIMRLPGTFNNKIPEERKEVTVIKADGPRYSLNQFAELVPENFEASAPAPEDRRGRRGRTSYNTASTTSSGLILDPNAEPGAVRLNALVKVDKKFHQSWDRNRPDLKDQSASSYNMSLADIAVRAGWPDQEVVNLMICWRRIHGFDLKLRERYYELTLARAKEPIRMESEQRKLEDTLTQPPEDEDEVLKDGLAILLGVDINNVKKYLGDPPYYYMDTDQGGITIGTIDKIYSQTKFREAVGAATNVVVPKVSGPSWEKRIQAILLLCEEVDVGDASHPAQETRTWIMDYLIERYVRSEDEWEKAAQRRFPFLMDGLIRIFLEDFSKWLEVNRNRNMDSHTLGRRMRQVSARPDKINVYIGGARTTRSIWILTDEFRPPQRDPDEPRDGGGAKDEPRDGGEAKDESRDGTEENGG